MIRTVIRYICGHCDREHATEQAAELCELMHSDRDSRISDATRRMERILGMPLDVLDRRWNDLPRSIRESGFAREVTGE